jgi:hypothetical protein
MLVIVLGPNPLLWIGQQTIIIGRIRSRPHQLLLRPRNIIKVGLPTHIEKSALPVKRQCTRVRLVYIKRPVPHFDTQHTCSFSKRQAATYQLERGRRVAHLLERTICIGLSYLLTLYWQFMISKFLLGFLPLEGFPR